MIDEKVLAGDLHELADRDDLSVPPVDQLLRRGHRSRLGRTAALSTLAAAVVAGAVIAANISTTSGHAPGPDAVATPSHVSFTLAADTTTALTFQIEIKAGLSQVKDPVEQTWNGAFDPATHNGYLRGADNAKTGDTCFLKQTSDGRWVMPGLMCFVTPYNLGAQASLFANPIEMLDALKVTGAATYAGRSGTGSAALDTWKFRVSEPTTGPQTKTKVTGTVTVNVSTNRVAAVVLSQPLVAGSPGTFTVSYEFSQYGAPFKAPTK